VYSTALAGLAANREKHLMAQAPAKNTTGRLIFIFTTLVGVAVIAGVSWKLWWPLLGGEPKYDTPPFAADYLPPDAGAVLYFNLREAQHSRYVDKELGTALRIYRAQFAPAELQQALGTDVTKDVDWLRVTLASGDLEHPLVMLGGRFDPTKFKPGTNGLRKVNKPGDRFRLYEWNEPEQDVTFTLAPGDGLILLCDKKTRATDALEFAAAGTKPSPEDTTLAGLLRKVDPNATVWGAASIKKLKPIPRLDREPTVEKILRPIINNADAVYGSVTAGNDLDGTLYFVAGNEDNATALESHVRSQCTLAKDLAFAAKFIGRKDPNLPLLQFLGAGDVTRDGNTVILHCHLPEKAK
jgi:hypothetical protein